MRNMYLFNMVTLDGYFEGSKKWEVDWHNVDAEFNDFAIKQLDATDLLVFGRVTYEGMADYWSTQRAIHDDPIVAGKMNTIQKIVVSKSLKKADWNNTKIVNTNVVEAIRSLKQQAGKEIGVLGSADLAGILASAGLIDEFRVIVNPVILGKGTPLFGNSKRTNLKLLRTKTFKSGNVLLCYSPVRP